MTDVKLPINYLDTGKVARDRINNSFNEVVETVAGYRPHIENGVWWIGNTNTGVKAKGDSVEMKVDDGYIWYKSSSVNQWTQIIALEDLKGDKGDQGDAATITVGSTTTGPAGSDACVTNSGTSGDAVLNFTIPQGAKGDTGDTGASICAAAFCGDDIVFTKDNSCTVTLCNAKDELKGDKGDQGDTGASIVSADFSGNDIVFTKDNCCTVTLCDAKTCLKGDKGDTGNGITCATSEKCGITTTVTLHYTDGNSDCFSVNDGVGDMLSCVYDPNGCGTDAFDYNNMSNTPVLCTVATSGEYCDLSGTPNLCAVATSGKYCDLEGRVTDNCQIANSCGFTTCTGTLVASDLNPYAKTCDLGTAASKNTGTSSGNVPVLDSNGKLNTTILPALAITDTFTVTNKSDLTGLTGAGKGDIGIVTSESKTYILSDEPYSTAANWKELATPTDAVTSVNSKTGAVTLDADDISDSTTTNKFVTSTEKCTWNGKAEICDIPTDNCQLGNSCGFTTCTGTLVASDLNPYAKSCDLCTVATSGKYCDLSGKPNLCTVATSGKYCDLTGTPNLCTVATSGKYCDLSGQPEIPTDNCQLANSCGFTTCTGTLVASDIQNLAQCCDIPTNNNQLTNGCGFTTCTGTLVASDLNPYAKSCTLCTVATSGKYCDLSGLPTIPTDNCELGNSCGYITGINCSDVTTALGFTPYDSTNPNGYTTCTGTVVAGDLAPYAKSCDLCTVATSGKYCDLTDTPNLSTVATSGKYCDLSGKPTIPTDNCQLANSCGYTTCTGTVVASDLNPYAKSCDLCTVATSGKYCDLTGLPSIPAAQIQSDWSQTCNTCKDYIKNKPNLCAVATSGAYGDLSGTPDLSGYALTCNMVCTLDAADNSHYPTAKAVSDALSCSGYGDMLKSTYDPCGCNTDAFNYSNLYNTPSLCTIATSGKYCDLTGKPTLGTVAACNTGTSSGNVPVLDSNGKLSTGVLPALAITDTFTVASCSCLTTLSSAEKGDIAISTGDSKTYILSDSPYSCASNWKELKTPTDAVSSVNGQTGAVCLTIPTDNCQLSNSCGYTTCTGTLVASDLNPYAKTCTLCTVATSGKYCDLTGKPSLCTVATSGKYCDLTGTPTIPTDNCQLANSCGYTTCTGTLVASDLNGYATTASLCTVATSGKYCDLSGRPSLCTVATSGKYCDLSGTPTIPTNNNQLTNGCGYTTCTGTVVASDLNAYAKCCDLKTVATSGCYCDLSGKPSLCAVATSGKYCDLSGKPSLCTVATSGMYCDLSGLPTIPTNNCQLSNGCGYTTCTGTLTSSNISDAAYSSSWNGVTSVAPSKNAVYDKIETLCTVPSGGSCGQVLTKTSSGCTWCDATGGISNDTTCTTTTVTGIWAGTEAEYNDINTKSGTILYFTF